MLLKSNGCWKEVRIEGGALEVVSLYVVVGIDKNGGGCRKEVEDCRVQGRQFGGLINVLERFRYCMAVVRAFYGGMLGAIFTMEVIDVINLVKERQEWTL